MAKIQFRLEGDQAETLAALLSDYINKEWGIDAENLPITRKIASDEKVELGTALGIISIVIGLPGFLESNMVSNLTQRIEAKKKLEQLLAWSLKQFPSQNTSIWLDVDQELILFDSDNLAQMLDAIQESQPATGEDI